MRAVAGAIGFARETIGPNVATILTGVVIPACGGTHHVISWDPAGNAPGESHHDALRAPSRTTIRPRGRLGRFLLVEFRVRPTGPVHFGRLGMDRDRRRRQRRTRIVVPVTLLDE